MSLKHGDKFDENIINQVVEVYKKSSLEIENITQLLTSLSNDKNSIQKSEKSNRSVIDYGKIPIGEVREETEIGKFIMNLPSDKAVVIGLLIQFGKSISYDDFKFPDRYDERKQEILKGLEITFKECEAISSLDKDDSNRETCYLFFKNDFSALLNWWNVAIRIINEIL